MKITKIVALTLVAALSVGCRYDDPVVDDGGDSETPTDPTDPTVPGDGEANKYAKLIDNSTTTTGRLTYTLATPSDVGAMSVRVLYPANEVETAYVTLFGTSGETPDSPKSAALVANLKLDSGNSSVANEVGIKRATTSSSSEDVTITDTTFTEGTWATIGISWSDGSYTVTLDETLVGTWSNVNDIDVKYVQMKLGNNANTTDYAYLVDDLVIYNNAASTRDTESGVIFEDDFESYELNVDLTEIAEYAGQSSLATTSGTAAEEEETEPGACEEGQTGTYPNCEDPVEEGDFPATLDEFKFTFANWSDNSATNGITLGMSGADNVTLTTATGAAGVDGEAVQIAQPADTAWGYFKYKDTETGAAEITGSFTAEAVIWVSTRVAADDVAIIDYADTSSYSGFKVYLEVSDGGTDVNRVKFKMYGTSSNDEARTDYEVKTDSAITTEAWNHVAVVYDADSADGTNGKMYIYINGVEMNTGNVNRILPVPNAKSGGDDFTIGGSSSSSDKNFDGKIDNVTTWNAALTAAQVVERAAMFDL